MSFNSVILQHASCLLKKILSRSFINLFSNKISASVEISVCYSFRVFYFQQNSFLHVISLFFLFSLYYRTYCFFHMAQCGDLLLLPKRSPRPMSCYYYAWIKLKADILEVAVKFAVSIPNLKRILCPQSVSVILLGLKKKKNSTYCSSSSFPQVISVSSACWCLGPKEFQFYLV